MDLLEALHLSKSCPVAIDGKKLREDGHMADHILNLAAENDVADFLTGKSMERIWGF